MLTTNLVKAVDPTTPSCNDLSKTQPSGAASTTEPMTVSPSKPICYPWKRKVLATVFWIGENPTINNPVSNHKSSWDPDWSANYGGTDCPEQRNGYLPAQFTPKQNPFYVALPYNDVTMGKTKPEASKVQA